MTNELFKKFKVDTTNRKNWRQQDLDVNWKERNKIQDEIDSQIMKSLNQLINTTW